jgi:hypothetical protein
MKFDHFAGIVAVVLVVVYLGAVMVKLWDPALIVVMLIGIVMMVIDLWQSIRSKNG